MRRKVVKILWCELMKSKKKWKHFFSKPQLVSVCEDSEKEQQKINATNLFWTEKTVSFMMKGFSLFFLFFILFLNCLISINKSEKIGCVPLKFNQVVVLKGFYYWLWGHPGCSQQQGAWSTDVPICAAGDQASKFLLVLQNCPRVSSLDWVTSQKLTTNVQNSQNYWWESW